MKTWSLRSKLALWTALLVTVVLILFGILSAWDLYTEKLEVLEKPELQPITPRELRAEADDALEDLIQAFATAFPAAVILTALGVWLITRKSLEPLREVAAAAEQIHAKALHNRIRPPKSQDEIGRLVGILNSMFERLERSFAQTSRFAADASHELRTPLTIMRAEIEEALKAEPQDSPHAAVLESLLEQTQRISGITGKLLLLARADAGQLQPELSPVDMSELCSELLEDAEILALPRGLQIDREIPAGMILKGDEVLLRQALLNLVDNAIKYNFQSGRIRLLLTEEGNRLRIEVSNTGPGIPVQHIPRLFERFYRADPSRSSETGGSGLGLSICREIILAHGGEMKFETPSKEWTSFVVFLPRAET